ncbi:hypothetical protein LINPERHAP2_LOCUS39561 [Linum perenne]
MEDDASKGFIPSTPLIEDGDIGNPRCPKIRFSEEEIAAFYRPWTKALVVRVLEKSFSYPFLKRRLEQLWAKAGHIQVSDLSNEFFLVRFSSADDYQRAMLNGPWKIFDYYITVARWSPDFNEDEPHGKTLTWVRLPKLPIHFFNHTAVNRIGNHIGRTIRMDLATAEGARARYARVCVEIDLSKPLLGKYMIGDRVFFVEYESLENVCHTCGHYGHKAESCPTLAPTVRPMEVEVQSSEIVAEAEVVGDAGSWMTVTRRRQRNTPAKKVDGQPRHQGAAAQSEQGTRLTLVRREGKGRDVGGEGPMAAPGLAKSKELPVADPIGQLKVITARMFPQDKMDSLKPPRPPLGDKTNTMAAPTVRRSSNKASGSASPKDDGLVNIPIIYSNPIFGSLADTSMMPPGKGGGRGATQSGRGKKAIVKPSRKPEVKSNIRSFKAQPVVKNPPVGSGSDASCSAVLGRPPDAEC